jgi:acyl phosphate:glycerol-3-phosphate acyltransferase
LDNFYLVLLIIGAYLLGSIPTAYLMAKWRRGIDIRHFGSGNIGASNAVATGSRLTSIIVIAVDFCKGALPVYIAGWIGFPQYQQVIVGLAAISGHNWTLFLHFSGGRGVLTTLGVIFAVAPWLALTLLVINFLFAPFRQFALGTLVVLVLLPVLSWFLPNVFRMTKSAPECLGFTAILALLVVRRLTAPRSDLAVTVSTGELVMNRLLFDRDIRDRKTWLKRGTSTAKIQE